VVNKYGILGEFNPRSGAVFVGLSDFLLVEANLAKSFARIGELEAIIQHWKERAAIAEAALREVIAAGDTDGSAKKMYFAARKVIGPEGSTSQREVK